MCRRRALILLAILATAIGAVAPSSASANGCARPWSGTGTATDPYLVATRADLAAIDACSFLDDRDLHWLQTADIDLSGADWVPIGYAGAAQGFTGTYDGSGHAISGLSVTEASAAGRAKGVFGFVNGGTIRRVTVRDARITGTASYYGVLVGDLDDGVLEDIRIERATIASTAPDRESFGGLVGGATDSTIRRVTVVDTTLSVTAASTRDIGGVAGFLWGTTLTDATVTGLRIEAAGNEVGGIVGWAMTSTISGSAAAGVVGGQDSVGGAVGRSCDSTVKTSTSAAEVTAAGVYGGGLMGEMAGYCPSTSGPSAANTVIDSSATGSVHADIHVGGLVGYLGSGIVERSYATGAATATSSTAGGLVGLLDDSTLTDVYALGAVNAPTLAGGLVGGYRGTAVVTRGYASGRVTGTTDAGGLIGGMSLACGSIGLSICSPAWTMTATASFWDAESTGQATSAAGTSRTTAQMRDRATFADASWPIVRGWQAAGTNTWGICSSVNGGRPFLLEQYAAATDPCPQVPSAPQSPKAAAQDHRLLVSWLTPADDGYTPITSYTATAVPGGKSCTVSAPTLQCTLTGLANEVRYTVSIVATNAKGAGAAATVKGTPLAPVTVAPRVLRGVITSAVVVDGPGTISQSAWVDASGRSTRGRQPLCRVAKTAGKAGAYVLRCRLSAATRAVLTRRPLRVRLVTRFVRSSGGTFTRSHMLTLRRTSGGAGVTG